MMKNGEWRESKKEHDKSKLLGVSSFFVVYLLYKLLYKKKKKKRNDSLVQNLIVSIRDFFSTPSNISLDFVVVP